MAPQDPAYAFNYTTLSLQRIFQTDEPISIGSRANLIVQYLDVTGIRWIDADDRFPSIGNFETTTITGMVNTNRADGSVALYREKAFDISKAPATPEAKIFNGSQYVYVRVGCITKDQGYNKDSTCPLTSPWLGSLPNVKQHEVIFCDDPGTHKIFGAKDCYIVGEATILAGQNTAQNCNITYSTTRSNTATCFVDRSIVKPSPDTRTNYTLESISETMRNMMPLAVTKEYMNLGLDNYTISMLHVAYHASWSSTTEFLSGSRETAQFNISEPVVRASVNQSRLYALLGMNLSLAVSAAFMSPAQRRTSTKTIRDVALAALTMDLSDVCQQSRTAGLCNAVVLNRRDKKLPRLIWDSAGKSTGTDYDSEVGAKRGCERKDDFVDDVDLR
ncbi:hypothetical protein EK21DRAFT_105916 [Setomelanomma holmii]|uniref:Uncharacterized protein n=1 Tax=Setomelanomma holmii TaxID=210430 RepID=A0A9P4LUA1_9PLEO|nr:hypothetical protein EK21DRAFT_105916 [Setomelanomma holmii]